VSMIRPVALRPNPNRPGTYLSGRLTQDFDGAFYMERPGYLRNTNVTVARGARFKFHKDAKWRKDLHLALDYGAPIGTPVYAVADGKIVKQGIDSTGGVFIYLQVRVGKVYKVIALYYHLQKGSFQFKTGDTVKRGQMIARSGNTGGKSTGGHLHFSLTRYLRGTPTWLFYGAGVSFDPQPFIKGAATLKDIAP
jgi:murein DD-endopeptidase MepM/ murein hydrolase activator NlpD